MRRARAGWIPLRWFAGVVLFAVAVMPVKYLAMSAEGGDTPDHVLGAEAALYLVPSIIILAIIAFRTERHGQSPAFRSGCALLLPVTCLALLITDSWFYLVITFIGQALLSAWAVWLAGPRQA